MAKQYVLYSKNDCTQCEYMKRFLDGRGFDYTVKNVEIDEEAVQYLKDNGFTGVPVLFGGEQPIVGFAPDKLVHLTKGE